MAELLEDHKTDGLDAVGGVIIAIKVYVAFRAKEIDN